MNEPNDKPEIEPMRSDLRALINTERERPGPSASQSDALVASILAAANGASGANGAAGSDGASGGGTSGGGSLARIVVVGVSALILGAAGGAWLTSRGPRADRIDPRIELSASIDPNVSSRPSPRLGARTAATDLSALGTSDTDRSVPASVRSASPSLGAPSSREIAPAPSMVAPTARPAGSESAFRDAFRDETLAAERLLVDTARTALMRGDARAALAATDEHAQRFSKGKLGEEREVIAIQALVAAGRKAEAVERGARFRKGYAGSVYLPIVDGALR